MSDSPLHLVKIPLRTAGLAEAARRRSISLRELDDGYLAHCLLNEIWQDKAPAPFVLRGKGRFIDVWGYTTADTARLAAHARDFGDPQLLERVVDVEGISSKLMPVFRNGQRLGFLIRACPVTRLWKDRAGHRAGAEVDAFLARCFAVGDDTAVSRETVYREWLEKRFVDVQRIGCRLERAAVAAIARERLVRRTQGDSRQAKRLERPDVRFEGDLIVENGALFSDFLSRGVGRHRAFGFGALIVVPPGTPATRD